MTREGAPTVVLAFDALSFRYLDRFDLPSFAAVRARGVEAPLRATHPPWTASAWPSMYTGTDPGHHGVYDFFDLAGAYPPEADLVTRDHVRAPAVWNYLNAAGRPAVVLNLPVTHPAEPVEGVVVPGYLAPEDEPGHPEGVREELSTAIGEPYRIYAETELSDDGTAKLDGYVDLVDRRRRAAEHLLATREWDLAIVQVQKTDAVFHNFDDEAAFERVYAAADELVGSVLGAVDDPVNVVVCSDHGMSPTTGYAIHVNEVLREHGLVEATAEGGGQSIGDRKREWIDGASHGRGEEVGVGAAASSVAVSAAERTLGAVGVTPGDVYSVAERAGLAPWLRRLVPDAATVGERVDWAASRAYCASTSELGVRINLAGREPDGIVPPGEYHDVRGQVIDVLSDLETPDGGPAFEFVEPREAIYDGPHAERAPDVVFRPSGMDNGVMTSMVGTRFVPVDEHNHDLDGVFVAAGPAFADDVALDRLSLTDVAPTLLAALGRPVPERMTGAVPGGLVAGPVERAAYGDVPYGSGGAGTPSGDGTSPGSERVRERLEDLGYL